MKPKKRVYIVRYFQGAFECRLEVFAYNRQGALHIAKAQGIHPLSID